jgi:capsular exopolysaccharide synthesis family protein
LRSQLTEQFVEAANRREVLAVQQSALSRAASRLNQQVQQMPFLARKYTDLQRELNVATESLNRFLAARETLQIEAAQKTLPWQLLSKPKVPENPILPKPQQNLILGALAGIFLGVGAALLSEKFDNALRSPEEIKENARVPLLGVIPFSKEIKSVDRAQVGLQSHAGISDRATPRETPQFHWYVASPFLESFRSLQANIRLLGSDTPTNSIVISSPEPADGKSTVAIHLAQAAAAMGRRVLLVDADLRRPQVHQFLDLPNFQGLSDAIATDLTPEQAIQEVPAWPNLHVLTAGSLPPDPTRLLASERMQQFVERFQSRFDLVIYDLPPSLGFADSRLLAPLTNGVIFVVRIGKTDRTKLKHTLDEFKTSKLTVLGIVANGTRGRGHSSYNYYQNYASPTPSRLSLTRFLRRR